MKGGHISAGHAHPPNRGLPECPAVEESRTRRRLGWSLLRLFSCACLTAPFNRIKSHLPNSERDRRMKSAIDQWCARKESTLDLEHDC